MNDSKLQTEYSGLVIIDGLEPYERTLSGVSEHLKALLDAEAIPAEIRYCDTADEMRASLTAVAEAAEQGQHVGLHFVIHGNQRGIGFNPNKQLVTWSELSPFLQRINKAMSGQLVVNMSSCYGLHGIKATFGNPYPFFGLIGSKRAVWPNEAKRINELFYKRQIEGADFNDIVDEVNTSFGEDILNLVSAAGYAKIKHRAAV